MQHHRSLYGNMSISIVKQMTNILFLLFAAEYTIIDIHSYPPRAHRGITIRRHHCHLNPALIKFLWTICRTIIITITINIDAIFLFPHIHISHTRKRYLRVSLPRALQLPIYLPFCCCYSVYICDRPIAIGV